MDETVCGRYLSCPWCDNVFSWRELCQWLEGSDDEPRTALWGRAPLPLIKFGPTVLEVTEFCRCGSPIVRECAEKVVFHLAVSPSAIESLLN